MGMYKPFKIWGAKCIVGPLKRKLGGGAVPLVSTGSGPHAENCSASAVPSFTSRCTITETHTARSRKWADVNGFTQASTLPRCPHTEHTNAQTASFHCTQFTRILANFSKHCMFVYFLYSIYSIFSKFLETLHVCLIFVKCQKISPSCFSCTSGSTSAPTYFTVLLHVQYTSHIAPAHP